MPTLGSDGVSINYIVDGEGPSIVLVHGFPASFANCFLAKMPQFADVVVQSAGRAMIDPWKRRQSGRSTGPT